MAPKDSTCFGCNKKFTKSEYCVQCVVCSLWIHKTCSGLSDEGFKFISDQLQATGIAYWACKPCTTYAMGINHRVKQIEEKITAMQHSLDANSAAVKEAEHKVEKMGIELQEKDEKMESMVKKSEINIYDELREREARRLNVVFHGIGEKRNVEGDTGKDRAAWDRKSCENIFVALELDIKEDAIKFCRRLGEKGNEPRPLLAGFHTETDRSELLRNAMKLEKTAFSGVNVSADLTKKQREEEKEMWKEAESRNETLSEADKSKNLQWMVVGARGEKRLIKCLPKEQTGGERRGGRTVRGRASWSGESQRGMSRGSAINRGRGVIRGKNYGVPRGSGANKTPLGARVTMTVLSEAEPIEFMEGTETEGSDTEVEEEPEEDETRNGARRKRKGRNEEGTVVGPPGKR
jgi:hypothetical protein